MAVVVLDEMDQLLSQDHSVLYDLFRLPQARSRQDAEKEPLTGRCVYASPGRCDLDPHSALAIWHAAFPCLAG